MSGGSATNYFIIENLRKDIVLEITSCTRAIGGNPQLDDNKQHIPVIIVYDANKQTIIAAGTVCDVTGGKAKYCSYVYLSSATASFPNRILVAGYSLTNNQLITNYNTPISPNRCGSGMLPYQSLYVKVLSNGAKCEVQSVTCPLFGTFVQQHSTSLKSPPVNVVMNPSNCQTSNFFAYTTNITSPLTSLTCEDIGNYTYSLSSHNLKCTGEIRILSAFYIFAYYYTEAFFVDYSDPSTAVCAFLNTGDLCTVPANRFRPRIYTFNGCYHAYEIHDYYWYANTTNMILGVVYNYDVYAQDPSGNGAWNYMAGYLCGINVLTLSPTFEHPTSSNVYELNVHSQYSLTFAIYFDEATSNELFLTGSMGYFLALVPRYFNNIAGRISPEMADYFFFLANGKTDANNGDHRYKTETISFTIDDNPGFEDLKTFSESYYIAVITCYVPDIPSEYFNDPLDRNWYNYGYYYARGYSDGTTEHLYSEDGYYLEAIYPFYEYFQYDYPFSNPPKSFGGGTKRRPGVCGGDSFYVSYANPVVKLNFDVID